MRPTAPVKRPNTVPTATSSGTDGNKEHQFKTQSYKWIMTWNNYPEGALGSISSKLAPKCEKWVFGLEQGEKEKTPHIQRGFILEAKTRMSTIFKLFGWKQGDAAPFWLKPMQGKWYDQKYCLKEGTAISNDKYFLQRKRTMRKQIEEFYPWQKKVIDELEKEPDERKIIYVNMGYKAGKTSLQWYICKKYGAYIFEGEKRHILAQVATNKEKDVFIYNQVADGCNIPWESIEKIKDGLFSAHFGTDCNGMVMIEHCIHIIIFSNKPLSENLANCHIDENRFTVINEAVADI